MKRDLDLIRLLLLRIEEKPVGAIRVDQLAEQISQNDHPIDVVRFHICLIRDAELIAVNDWAPARVQNWQMGKPAHKEMVLRLTNAGYDYLDAVRDVSRWSKIKSRLSEESGSVPLEVVKALGIALIQSQLGL